MLSSSSKSSLVKPLLCLRTKSHLNTRLQLRDEQAHAYRLIPWLALVNIGFGFVDCLTVPTGNYVVFFAIRIFVVILSRVLYLLLRGRARYGLRLFVTVAPYMYGVEYVMLSEGLILTPYFAGLALVMVTSTMLFPVKNRVALVVYAACIVPVLVYVMVHPLPDHTQALNVVLMSLGTVITCSVNSGQVCEDLRQRLIAKEALSRDLGAREKEIRRKAEELLGRQIFEAQFSPQVVKAVLRDRSLTREMRRLNIVNVVIDIENSTLKARSIDPKVYKEVIEEVLDVFSAACLKWNITLDRFTGDGVQAFAGAPVAQPDDLLRSVMACKDSMEMLWARRQSLELLWKDTLKVRFAVCRGEALVGFIGRGVFRSYTALGEMVSFTHRISSLPEPWTIAAYLWDSSESELPQFTDFTCETRQVRDLKGFGSQAFAVSVLKPKWESKLPDAGRCRVCQTPMVIGEDHTGLPRVYCPGCQSRGALAA